MGSVLLTLGRISDVGSRRILEKLTRGGRDSVMFGNHISSSDGQPD